MELPEEWMTVSDALASSGRPSASSGDRREAVSQRGGGAAAHGDFARASNGDRFANGEVADAASITRQLGAVAAAWREGHISGRERAILKGM
jgi:hypothetical protein